MANKAGAYKMEHRPIRLKTLALECDISQAYLADLTELSRPTVNLVLNRGYLPAQNAELFKRRIEDYLMEHLDARRWLAARDLEMADIWKEDGGADKRRQPAGARWRTAATRAIAPAIPGDPQSITAPKGVEMVKQEVLKHFKLFRNPFIDDIQKESDIFMSDEHRYIEMAMLDAAHHGGFLAVIGECGSGKSVMRRKVVGELKKDGDVRVIFPQIIDKGRMNASAICDAIVMDLSEEAPKMKLEAKARQIYKLLLERSKGDYRCILIIEEAHDLNVPTLKYLKRFYELEDGFRKLLGIILIGQTELKQLLDEGIHSEMREVIRRIQVAEISGLNGNLRDYLTLKFRRVNAKIDDIFDDDALTVMSERLTKQDRLQKKLSHAYPLMVNNLTARAMTKAYELGEEKVTKEVMFKA
jgi:type II secretory pathway predicted ATPase ExeA